jgi:hypothetical protein
MGRAEAYGFRPFSIDSFTMPIAYGELLGLLHSHNIMKLYLQKWGGLSAALSGRGCPGQARA